MSVYAVNKLMDETRRLAADYYRTTGQTLPVTAELARYDAQRLLSLSVMDEELPGVDAVDEQGQKIQVKGRVIFNPSKGAYRVGQLNTEGCWDVVMLVLMDPEYNPLEIYGLARDTFLEESSKKDNPKRSQRGAMSVSKFKAIGDLLWSADQAGDQRS